MPHLYPVILSGGSGTRLWPMSRQLFPKQLFPLCTQNSMLQETVLRVSGTEFNAPLVICNHDHRFIVAEQLRSIDAEPYAIVLEPCQRNTAPAVAISAMILTEQDPDAVLIILPSDHNIKKIDSFLKAIETGLDAANSGTLVTFGIVPERPETGYGYIQRGNAYKDINGCFNVKKFIEKPNIALANKFVSSGGFYWNSGIFLFSASTYLEEMKKYEPATVEACRLTVNKREKDLDFSVLDESTFSVANPISIDYAVMEKTDFATVVPVDIGWSDVGAWSALWEICDKNDDGNIIEGDAFVLDVENSYIRSDNHLIAVAGVENLVVISTEDTTLVIPRDKAEDTKRLVELMKSKDRSEPDAHLRVYRPWGWYQTIDHGEGFLVKRISVKPGGKLSLQKHQHRDEHWVVLNGVAKVTKGDDVFHLNENESTHISAETPHRLENPGDSVLYLVEVQSGSYLSEDDIVRFEDAYGREMKDEAT